MKTIPPRPPSLHALHSATTTGIRESNQDRVCAETSQIHGKPAVVLTVADGMGGMKAGDQAAEIAIAAVQRFSKDVLPSLPPSQEELRSALANLFQQANREIWEYSQSHDAEGMGTTLVVFLAFAGRYLVANVGDSRCYYINNFESRQITEDHSRVQDLVRLGSMTPEAAARSPYRNQLTRSLGEPVAVTVDLFPAGANYGVIDEDCAFLLSSDGLHGVLSEQDIFLCLRGTRNLQRGCDNLMSSALHRGSTDNITVAAVEFGKLARKSPRQECLPRIAALLKRRSESSLAARSRRLRCLLVVVFALILALIWSGGVLLRQRIPVSHGSENAKSVKR